MGLQATTQALTYARNEYIKQGVSHIFDRAGDMIYAGALMPNLNITGASPSRQMYWRFTATGTLTGGMTGIEIRSTFNGAATTTQSITGAEIKARHTTGNTSTVGQLRGVVGNADTKNGTTTTAYGLEASIDVASGGTITTGALIHANLNNSGTVTNSYVLYGEGTSGVYCDYGIYLRYLKRPWYSSSVSTASGSAFYLGHSSSATSGGIYGVRLSVSGTTTSASTATIRGVRAEAEMGASAKTALLEAGLFNAKVSEGGVDVTECHVLTAQFSSGATAVVDELYVMNVLAATRGDETISGDDELLHLENEAVGGNGRKMDAWIRCKTTNLSGVNGADYLIDGGTSTDLVGTAVFRFPDDQTICSNDNQSILVNIASTNNDGFIKVIIGTETKYIALYDTKTS